MDKSLLKVFVLTVAFLPLRGDSRDFMKLEGIRTTKNGTPVYQLICVSSEDFHGCSVEFLLNGRTQENIRYANNTCYKGNGVCKPFQCACFDGCKKLTWYTEGKNIENQLFECEARFKFAGGYIQFIASGSFKRGDFVKGTPKMNIIGGNHSPSQIKPINTDSTGGTVRKETYISNSDHQLLIATAVFIFLISILVGIILCINIWICSKLCRKSKIRRS